MRESTQPKSTIFFRLLELGTIRTRLLILFVVLVFLPAGITTTISAIQGAQAAEERVIAQLETVATLKETEIQTWIESLHNEILIAITTEQTNVLLNLILDGEPDILASSTLRTNFRKSKALSPNFKEIFLINRNGLVIDSTERSSLAQTGKNYSNMPIFSERSENIVASTLIVDVPKEGDISVLVIRHLKGQKGEFIGAVAAWASIDTIEEIMLERAGLGETGETYLINEHLTLLTSSRSEENITGKTLIQTDGSKAAAFNNLSDSNIYDGYQGQPVIGLYHWIPEYKIALLAEQERSEALAAANKTLVTNIGLTFGSLFIAILIGLFVVRSIADPLGNLTETAAEIANGDFEREVKVKRRDEIGELAGAIDTMRVQVRDLVGGLESRVEERTQELAGRTAQLEAIADLTRSIASADEVGEELLLSITQKVSGRFGFYHVGIFLFDSDKNFAILRATNSQIGQKMLQDNHRLAINSQSFVGSVAAQGTARIALDVEKESNSDLPETRSELALPLKVGTTTIGILDIHSTERNAFSQEYLNAFLILADQISIAIQNAQSLEQAQQALALADRATRQLTGQTWDDFRRSSEIKGFHFDGNKSQPLSESSDIFDGETLKVPILFREQEIANLSLRASEPNYEWTKDEIAIIVAAADRAAFALENARLLEDAQRRASQERAITEMSSSISATTDVDAILQATLRELQKNISGTDIIFQLDVDDEG